MLNPKFSYEFNRVMNPELDEQGQVKNFASLFTDKDRFLNLMPDISSNKELIEKHLGFELPDEIYFYIVRSDDKITSFSEPITIEYSVEPEYMVLRLLKEIIKVNFPDRFPDEDFREELINDFLYFIFKKINENTYGKIIGDVERDFENNTFRDYVGKFYEDNPDFIDSLRGVHATTTEDSEEQND